MILSLSNKLSIINSSVKPIFKLGILLLLTLSNFQPIQAAQDNMDAFDCTKALAGDAQQQYQSALELLDHSYNTSKLGCAVDLFIKRANQDLTNYDAQLLALEANARHIYYLDRIVLYELGYLIAWYVTEVPEETKLNVPMRALIAARMEQLRLLQQTRDAGFEQSELNYFEAQSLGPTVKAKPLLQAVIDADPKSLAGAAHALLAEIYYALPDIAGGDINLAISLMREAWTRAPNNPRYPVLLAGYLVDVSQTEAALKILKQILAMDVTKPGLQLMADQLRISADLATRLTNSTLSKQLAGRRDKMLSKYPYLQQRTVVSAMGHFGDKDPMDNQ